MALVIKSELIDTFLSTKLNIKDGVSKSVKVDNDVHLEIISYPPQNDYKDGIDIAIIKKPFIDFVVSCGGAGAMTTKDIFEKYDSQIPELLASAIVDEFSKAYNNYVIIPNIMSLIIASCHILDLINR